MKTYTAVNIKPRNFDGWNCDLVRDITLIASSLYTYDGAKGSWCGAENENIGGKRGPE